MLYGTKGADALNINIYYGGRGIIDDPTLTVIDKMISVFDELRVTVSRYNLYEYKNTIPTLSQTIKEADGVILATTVEWHGIGGYMTQFLDSVWQFGDKEKIAEIYMMPVVMSRTYGEKEARLDLVNAWEILGGKTCNGLCGYIENSLDLEINQKYTEIIEKNAEGFYRCVNQKPMCFPASNRAIRQKVALPSNISLTQQESEQLSEYVSDDKYVQTQKEDIQELTSMFLGKMGAGDSGDEYIESMQKAFKAKPGVSGSFKIHIAENGKNIVMTVSPTAIECEYGDTNSADVLMDMNKATLDEITSGRMTFQRAFMSGAMSSMKGDFRILCALDEVLEFK